MAKKLSDLEKTHKGFSTPNYSIKVGGSEIKQEDFPIVDLSVRMSAGFDMGSCEFTIAGVFNPQKGKFEKDIYTKFKPGKVVEVKMGYNKTTGLFMGYINAISFDFSAKSGPYITVQCLDAKGALVNNKTWKNYGKQDIKDIVKAILTERCKPYVTTISSIDSDFDTGESGAYDETPEIKDNIDDYNYVIGFARKTNNSFCVIYNKLYFCENLSSKSKTVVELKWGQSLLSFWVEIDISKQIGTVQVYGTDPIKHKTFTAKSNSVSGSGETGSDMAKLVKSKTIVLKDPNVINQAQATELAKHRLEASAAQLVKCKGSTIGIPEIKAGDKIEISGMGKGVNGVYFLEHVTHTINAQGYITAFEGRSSGVK